MSRAPLRVIDSHTEGESTRVAFFDEAPLMNAADRSAWLAARPRLMSAVIGEPRGHAAMVGAFVFPAENEMADVQVVYFNNAGCLNMCVHGTLGVAETLRYMNRVSGKQCRFETSAGLVEAAFLDDRSIAVTNVVSRRTHANLALDVGDEIVHGDVAWGGNWFFLASADDLELEIGNLSALELRASEIQAAYLRVAASRTDLPPVDHVELFGPPTRAGADAKNFVRCPGGEYDRSPCGTGTSAKLACLAADGELDPGKPWRQESILGSLFVGTYEPGAEGIVPTLSGRAYVTAQSTLLFDENDPYADGFSIG